MKIEAIIVVEGRDDTNAIRRSVDAETIETHGYGIREETWEMLEKAYETKGLIIFTDPDPAGERIRRRLTERFPKAMQAFLDRNDAAKEGDIGIENAKPEAIRHALSRVHGPKDTERNNHGADHRGSASEESLPEVFTMQDMDGWGLNGASGSAELRRALGKELGIGFAGAKSFLRRLNHFGISREEIEGALRRI